MKNLILMLLVVQRKRIVGHTEMCQNTNTIIVNTDQVSLFQKEGKR
jgi:hypothetical protein